jgi:hypothetical protein
MSVKRKSSQVKAKAVINIISLRSRNLLDLRQLMSYGLSARSPH